MPQAELSAVEEALQRCREAHARCRTALVNAHSTANISDVQPSTSSRARVVASAAGQRRSALQRPSGRRSSHEGYSRRWTAQGSGRSRCCRGYRVSWTSTGREHQLQHLRRLAAGPETSGCYQRQTRQAARYEINTMPCGAGRPALCSSHGRVVLLSDARLPTSDPCYGAD